MEPARPDAAAPSEKRRELAVFLFVSVVLFPLLAIISVSGFGFIVWMSQLLWLGPPDG